MNSFLRITVLVCLLPFSSQAQHRNDAGLRGGAGATSGFFETPTPVNYPLGAQSWWHLLDVRHSNLDNNYAMQFAGSFYNQHLYFRKTDNDPAMPWSRVLLETNGMVGIGTDNPTEKLSVNGKVRAKEVKVEVSNWPDYVFEKDYELTPLDELEKFIVVNKHLPEVPSAKAIESEGLALGEMNKILLKKIEELTLFIVDQNKRIKKLEDAKIKQ